jgi:hypothetical protein
VVIDKSFFDGSEEEVVESSIDDEDEDFGSSVPVFVDLHKSAWSVKVGNRNRFDSHWDWGRDEMCGYPNDEHRNINHSAKIESAVISFKSRSMH